MTSGIFSRECKTRPEACISIEFELLEHLTHA
jgi:hypothetical protein